MTIGSPFLQGSERSEVKLFNFRNLSMITLSHYVLHRPSPSASASQIDGDVAELIPKLGADAVSSDGCFGVPHLTLSSIGQAIVDILSAQLRLLANFILKQRESSLRPAIGHVYRKDFFHTLLCSTQYFAGVMPSISEKYSSAWSAVVLPFF